MVLKRAYGRLISLHYELKLHLEIRFSLLLMMISIYISCCLFRKQCHVQTPVCATFWVCANVPSWGTHTFREPSKFHCSAYYWNSIGSIREAAGCEQIGSLTHFYFVLKQTTKQTFTQKSLGIFLYVTYQLFVKVQIFQRFVLNWVIGNFAVGLHVLVY